MSQVELLQVIHLLAGDPPCLLAAPFLQLLDVAATAPCASIAVGDDGPGPIFIRRNPAADPQHAVAGHRATTLSSAAL